MRIGEWEGWAVGGVGGDWVGWGLRETATGVAALKRESQLTNQ